MQATADDHNHPDDSSIDSFVLVDELSSNSFLRHACGTGKKETEKELWETLSLQTSSASRRDPLKAYRDYQTPSTRLWLHHDLFPIATLIFDEMLPHFVAFL